MIRVPTISILFVISLHFMEADASESDAKSASCFELMSNIVFLESLDDDKLPEFQSAYGSCVSEMTKMFELGMTASDEISPRMSLRLALQEMEGQLHSRISAYQAIAHAPGQGNDVREWLKSNSRTTLELAHRFGVSFIWEAEKIGSFTVVNGKVEHAP